MVVYGDLLFLINFSMDFLCFYISCLLVHQKLPILRVLLSSFLGGVYSVAALFVSVNKATAIFLDLSVLVLMCLTVYLNKGVTLAQILKRIFLYFFVSALLGGLMTALFSLLNRIEILADDLKIGEGVDAWAFVLLVIIGSVMTLKGGKIYRSSSSQKIVTLKIENELGVTELRALIDSGNLATEPISGKAVVFASMEKCKNIIDKSIYCALNNSIGVEQIPMEIMSKIRIVPTQVLSEKILVPAMKFKRVSVNQGKKKKDIDVFVAFVNGTYLGEYDAILSDEAMI